jgi:CheY-like chemotaxis protein
VNLAEKKVLYIEDNATNRFLMEMVFQQFDGFELELANDAEQGIAHVTSSSPDLILMDKNLPNMSGLEATQLLKSNPQYQRIPIIMLTADCNAKTIAQGKAAGCEYVEGKPFDIAKLQMQITELVNEGNNKKCSK